MEGDCLSGQRSGYRAELGGELGEDKPGWVGELGYASRCFILVCLQTPRDQNVGGAGGLAGVSSRQERSDAGTVQGHSREAIRTMQRRKTDQPATMDVIGVLTALPATAVVNRPPRIPVLACLLVCGLKAPFGVDIECM